MHALRLTLRSLFKRPGYSLTIVVVLALGIGANAAVFTAIDHVVLRPLPYADAERLATLWEDFSTVSGGAPRARVSPATFRDWQRRTARFEQLAAYRRSGLNVTGAGAPESLSGVAATANLLPLLGVPPLAGRTFVEAEETAGSRVVVIGYGLWQGRFGGDSAAIGRSILLNGEPYTVIGIMPPRFRFPDIETQYWIPMAIAPAVAVRRNSHFLYVVGRLAAGVEMTAARAEMDAIAKQLAAEYPATNDRVGISVIRLRDDLVAGADRSLLILFAAAGCVLLIGCANVASLILARGATRRHELALRTALGATRGRLFADVLIESAALAGAGTLAALVLAQWALQAIGWVIPAGIGSAADLVLDARVIIFAAATALFTIAAAGVAPAALAAFQDLSRTGWSGRIAGGSTRARAVLVTAEIALAVLLAAAAGLMIETLVKVRALDSGFRSDRILTASIAVPLPKYADADNRRAFYDGVLSRVRSLPGVESAGLTSDLPFTSRGNTMSILIEGREPSAASGALGNDALFRLVSAGYLETIGARLVDGRLLDDGDRERANPVVVVNDAFARRYWPGESPLGRRLDTGTGSGGRLWLTVVGVVADIRERGVDYDLEPAVYVPYAQTAISFFQPSEIAVRTAAEPTALAAALRRAVWSVDAEQPIANVRPFATIVDDELAGRQRVLMLLTAFAALAVLLAALGIYGVLSFVVGESTREIGVRIAIGATPFAVVFAVMRRAAAMAIAGVAIGLAAAVVATRLLASLLFGVSPLDPIALSGAAALLLAVAMAAAYAPARRAAAIDPIEALRAE